MPRKAAPTPKCGARTRTPDQHPCTHTAGEGTDHVGFGHCKLHGGASPGGKKHAQRQAAEHAVATYGLPRDIDPADALLEEVHRTAGAIDFLTAQIRELDPDALVWGWTEFKNKTGGDDEGVTDTQAAGINVWLELYHRERRHFVDVCKAALAAGVEERRVKLAEQQGELAGQALRAILTGLSLTASQRKKVPGLVREHLTLLQGGAA
jgi:hypothetical protein